MEKKKLMVIIAVAAALVILVAAVAIAYVVKSGNDSFENSTAQSESEGVGEETSVLPEFKINSVTERDRDVLVETTYGNFTYPYAFSDIVSMKSVYDKSTAELQVYAVIDKEELAVYTVHYNKEEGDIFGKLKLEGYDEPVSLYVEFAEVPDGLADNWLATYNAAQETFNDIRVSMAEDPAFTSAE